MNRLTSSVIQSVAATSPSSSWIFSPASYLEAMYRVGLCANGGNAQEIVSALGSTVGALPVEATRFASVIEGFDSYNCILSRETYRDFLVPLVLEVLQSLGSDVLTYASSDDAVSMVNRLVEEKTHGRITDLITRDDVSKLTQLIILNCVYFKRSWYYQFDASTRNEPFYNADGTITEMGLLKRQEYFRYYEGPGYDIVEVKYRDTDICCYLIVPTVGSLSSILDGFEYHYANIAKVGYGLECHLTVPPFKVENTWRDLPEMTQRTGIRRAFEKTQEWSLFDWVKMGGGWAKVDKIIQKAYLDFTREGTEATAATAVMMLCASGCTGWGTPPLVKYIRADKPFLFCLANHKRPEIPLFVGAVNQV